MKEKLFGIIGIAIAITAWYAIVHVGLINPLIGVSPERVFLSFLTLFYSNSNVILDILTTIYRMILGLALSILVGVPLGVIMGYSRRIYSLFQPLVDFIRSVPAPALFPLFILLFGIGDISKIMVVFFGCVTIILINAMYGVHHSNKTRMLFAKTLGGSNFQILKKITFWDALPEVLVGVRQSISIALIIIVVTEMFAGTNIGIGQKIYDDQLTFNVGKMYAEIILIGIIGYLFNLGFVRFERRAIHWIGKN